MEVRFSVCRSEALGSAGGPCPYCSGVWACPQGAVVSDARSTENGIHQQAKETTASKRHLPALMPAVSSHSSFSLVRGFLLPGLGWIQLALYSSWALQCLAPSPCKKPPLPYRVVESACGAYAGQIMLPLVLRGVCSVGTFA